ncbi:MAG: hypothetical protein HY707_00485 [Ignavibacteriae bacterium]|nr:hypothetical protein [Ignavibacteriota bacterium]
MKKFCMSLLLFILMTINALAGEEQKQKDGNSNLQQYISGKFGFYQASDGLNNGLLFGIDGITEFTHHNFFLSGAIDAYYKQTFDFFKDPKLDISKQAIILLPLHANFGYELVEAPTADTRVYAGIGGGYYFYFYSIDYRKSSGGLLGSLTTESESKNGGSVFATMFVRTLIGKIFIEPRIYLASKDERSIGGSTYVVNPSGFAITLGFQYH